MIAITVPLTVGDRYQLSPADSCVSTDSTSRECSPTLPSITPHHTNLWCPLYAAHCSINECCAGHNTSPCIIYNCALLVPSSHSAHSILFVHRSFPAPFLYLHVRSFVSHYARRRHRSVRQARLAASEAHYDAHTHHRSTNRRSHSCPIRRYQPNRQVYHYGRAQVAHSTRAARQAGL